MKKIIGLVGFKGSGKDTVADYIVQEFGFTKESLANPVKDTCSSIFGWDRNKLEGILKEDRKWREQEDAWWSKTLNIKNFSPRYALQQVGTEIFRDGFNQNIWVYSLQNRILNSNKNTIIADCRFLNEINFIKQMGGIIILVKRKEIPHWGVYAKRANLKNCFISKYLLKYKYKIHPSEYSWIGGELDYTVDNKYNMDYLKYKTTSILFQINKGK